MLLMYSSASFISSRSFASRSCNRARLPLGQGLARRRGNDGQGEEHQHRVLSGAELQGDLGNGLGDDDQDDAGEEAAKAGAEQGSLNGLARLALFCQGVSVGHGGRGGNRAGGADEDGRHRAAEGAGVIGGQQHDEGLGGGEIIGERNDQGDRHGGGETGNGAQNHTDEDAAHQVEQVFRL